MRYKFIITLFNYLFFCLLNAKKSKHKAKQEFLLLIKSHFNISAVFNNDNFNLLRFQSDNILIRHRRFSIAIEYINIRFINNWRFRPNIQVKVLSFIKQTSNSKKYPSSTAIKEEQFLEKIFDFIPRFYKIIRFVDVKIEELHFGDKGCSPIYIKDIISIQNRLKAKISDPQYADLSINFLPKKIIFKIVPTYSSNNRINIKSVFCLIQLDIITKSLKIGIKSRGLIANERKESLKYIKVNKIKILFNIVFSQNIIYLDKLSRIELDEIICYFISNLDINDKDFFNISFFCEFYPQDIIKLIPDLYVQDLKELQSDRKLTLKVGLGFLISNPLYYDFHLSLDVDERATILPGISLSYLNYAFDFRFQGGTKTIPIAEVNKSLSESLLGKVLVHSEDPNFYHHRGVDEFGLGYAIARNFHEKRVVRGGSTITMQVVKNLFLTNERMIFRKIEEVIIALLIENHFKIPKRRILDIYFEIIEMGPNIYGLNNGCMFYFGKQATEVNLIESIVISYIIPRPIFFFEALVEKSEKLRKNLDEYSNKLLINLLNDGIIDKEDLENIEPIVFFTRDLGSLKINFKF